jgi:hypothetical protein
MLNNNLVKQDDQFQITPHQEIISENFLAERKHKHVKKKFKRINANLNKIQITPHQEIISENFSVKRKHKHVKKKLKRTNANHNKLPDEMLVEIFTKLAEGIKKPNELGPVLLSLKLTSQKFQDIAIEVEANYIKDHKVSLKELGLKTESDAVIFAKKMSKYLKRLDLSQFSKITDKHLEEIIQVCPNLETIVINSDHVTNKSLQTLSSLKKLSSLSLFYCMKVTDEGFNNLTVLNQLTFLDIVGCMDIKEEGLQSIATLMQLKKLGISECWFVTKEMIQMLAASLSELIIFDIRNCDKITDVEALNLIDKSEVGLQIIRDTNQFPPRIRLEQITI